MKKKILFVLYQLDCGGVEKALLKLLDLIDTERYECELLTIRNEGEFCKEFSERMKIIEYNCPDFLKTMFRYHKPSKPLDGSSIEKIFWNLLFFINKISVRIFKKNILFFFTYKIYKKKNLLDNYDMVIDFHGYGSYTTYIAAMEKDIPIKVSWIHEQNIYRAYTLIKDVYKYFDKIFGCSLDCCNNFKKIFPQCEAKLDVYYNYLNVDEIKSKAKLEPTTDYFNDDSFKIVSVGRVTEQKAFDRAIKVSEKLKSKGHHLKWIIVGDGNQREEFVKLVNDKNLQNELVFHGFDSNPYSYISRADLYVQTSIAEGFCTTISEAIILGKPIVSTDVGGVNEQIGDGKGGIIVEQSEDAIYNAIEKLINDKELLKNMAEHNLCKDMDYEKEIEKLCRILIG